MLRKIIRKVDKRFRFEKTYQSVSNLEESQERIERKLSEISWGLIFNNAISNSNWFLNKSVNPGRWAAGYPLLYILYRIYNDIKPKNILEFGLGESTKLAYQYVEAHRPANLTIVEQDKEWLNFFSKEIFDIRRYTLLLNLKNDFIKGHETNIYDGLLNEISNQKFDFVCIDGPWGSDNYSRYQIVQIAERNLLSDDFIIIMDDFERIGEQQTVDDLKEILNFQNKIFYTGIYSGQKDSFLLCSEKYKFLTSL